MNSPPPQTQRARLPKRWVQRFEATQRDLRFLVNGLRGVRGPVVQNISTPPAARTHRALIAARHFEVEELIDETPEAVSIYLRPVNPPEFSFKPGQFLTLLIPHSGGDLRRAYSLANPATGQARPHITVKQVTGGKASHWVRTELRPGMRIRALGPSGSFLWRPDQTASQTIVMFAGGSGITPIMSILHTALETSDEVKVHLLYGNRRYDSIIFRKRLEQLQRQYPERLTVLHVLDEGIPEQGTEVGRVTEERVTRWLSDPARSSDHIEYFLCGPTGMMQVVRASLGALDVQPDRIRSESFQSPRAGATSQPSSGPETCIFQHGDAQTRVVAATNQTILEAGLDAGLDLSFSCGLGGCGACRIKILSGKVSLQEPNCLTDQEREAGYTLACVGRPEGPVRLEVTEQHDD